MPPRSDQPITPAVPSVLGFPDGTKQNKMESTKGYIGVEGLEVI